MSATERVADLPRIVGAHRVPGSARRAPPVITRVQPVSIWDHACALTSDGKIECWGTDYAGETTPPS